VELDEIAHHLWGHFSVLTDKAGNQPCYMGCAVLSVKMVSGLAHQQTYAMEVPETGSRRVRLPLEVTLEETYWCDRVHCSK
jgi:hypothetical protein